MSNDQKQIDYIMKNFDFEKVRVAMAVCNWTWLDSVHSPTLSELKDTAFGILMVLSANKDIGGGGTGGFTAFRENGYLGLEFTLESVCSDTDTGEE